MFLTKSQSICIVQPEFANSHKNLYGFAMSKHIGIYPGSFDPVTFGHLDILRQSLVIADKVVVAIGVHSGKVPMFTFEQRGEMIRRTVEMELGEEAAGRIEVISFDNLAVTAARGAGAGFMIRGLRDGTDLDYEMQLAGMNGAMAPEITTVYLPASPLVRPITATLVRQIAQLGGDVSQFVPTYVVDMLKSKFNNS
jgi:pantetheine-phosphate adenylyltransferase